MGAFQTASAFHIPSVPRETPYMDPQCYKSLLQEMVLLPWESPVRTLPEDARSHRSHPAPLLSWDGVTLWDGLFSELLVLLSS